MLQSLTVTYLCPSKDCVAVTDCYHLRPSKGVKHQVNYVPVCIVLQSLTVTTYVRVAIPNLELSFAWS